MWDAMALRWNFGPGPISSWSWTSWLFPAFLRGYLDLVRTSGHLVQSLFQKTGFLHLEMRGAFTRSIFFSRSWLMPVLSSERFSEMEPILFRIILSGNVRTNSLFKSLLDNIRALCISVGEFSLFRTGNNILALLTERLDASMAVLSSGISTHFLAIRVSV